MYVSQSRSGVAGTGGGVVGGVEGYKRKLVELHSFGVISAAQLNEYLGNIPSLVESGVAGTGGGVVGGVVPEKYSFWSDFDDSTKEYWLSRGVDEAKFNAWRAATESGLPMEKLEDMFPEFYDVAEDTVSYDRVMELLYTFGDKDVDQERSFGRLPENWVSGRDVVWPRDLYYLGS